MSDWNLTTDVCKEVKLEGFELLHSNSPEKAWIRGMPARGGVKVKLEKLEFLLPRARASTC